MIIDPQTQDRHLYLFGPTPHGGGYDDITFRSCDVYLSASNPARNPNNGPAIVSVHLEGNLAQVEPLLEGEANAIDIPTDTKIQLNLQDPDSMTLDLLNNIVLDSQADQEIIVVTDPGSPNQRALRVPLSYVASDGTITSVETDDTAFASSSQGFLLFADKGLNAVYKITKKAFSPGIGLHGCGWWTVCRHTRLHDRPHYASGHGAIRSRRHGLRRHIRSGRRRFRQGAELAA